jgi:hypothetical protein
VLSIAAIVGYAGYANHAAERAAQSFCGKTEVGSEVSAAVSRARNENVRYRGPRTTEGREEHDFEFRGWVFNMGVCRVGVANGKVTSVAALLEGD